MVGARTAPYPPFLLPMPDQAAVALARALQERGEEALAVNGALPAVDLCAAELVGGLGPLPDRAVLLPIRGRELGAAGVNLITRAPQARA